MVLNVGDALSAYSKSGNLLDSAASSAAPSSGGGENFGSVLKGFLGDSINTLHEGETKAMASTTGEKTDLASVVTAMDNAELMLTEITTIRDKVIAAYQAITSSAI